ncbi:MAG: PAS domain-containing sensor histidine kinase [Planctomycetota bacterium]|jgi:PAS domain S-box-containing protein
MDQNEIRILLVEDDKAHVELIRRAFGSEGVHVSLAAVGTLREAREHLAESLPHLLVTDLRLPDGRGMDLLPGDRENAAFPVVVLTSHGDEQAAVEVMKAGASDYIVKTDATLAEMPHIAQRALREWHNVAERRRAEQALRESEEKFRILAERSPNMIFINQKGKVVYANQKCAETMGYTREEFYAPDFDFLTLIAPESVELTKSNFESHSRGEEVEPCEYALASKSGKRIDSIITTKLIPYGDEPAILGIVTDITERKQAEEALRESEEKFRILAERSPNMIFINRKGRVVYANERCEEIMGYTRDEFYAPDFDFLTLIAPEFKELVKSSFRKHMAGEEIEPYEYALVSKNRKRIKAILTTRLIRYGKETAILGIATDVTERLQAEERLREMEARLAHVARLSTMGEMVAGIAHEVSQPLYTVVNFAKATGNVLAGDPEPDLDNLREWNEEIAAAAGRAGEIIARLRDFVRRKESRRAPARINEIVNESVELVAFEARRRSVTVERALCRENPVVNVDRVQIQQVFVNLLRNAYEALEDQAVTGRRVTVRTDRGAGIVEVSVADDGLGLPTEDRVNVFDAFVTTKPEGLGMGLAISKTIVGAHGGKLWAASRPGQGASLHLTLPLAAGDTTDAE